MLAEVFKILGSTENYTRIAEFKAKSVNYFNIQPNRSITKMGFETTQVESNG